MGHLGPMGSRLPASDLEDKIPTFKLSRTDFCHDLRLSP